MIKPTIIIFFTLIIGLTLVSLAAAQPGLPGAPEQSPLGGIELLAIAGGGYAIKKLAHRNSGEGELRDQK